MAQKIYPFKFLDAYSKDDIDLFFGRNEEIEQMYQGISQSGTLLVYGASGTGKSSLINCGLAAKFQSTDWLALNVRRGDNINVSLQKVLDEYGGTVNEQKNEKLSNLLVKLQSKSGGEQQSPLARSFKAIYRNYFRPIYLIFDQFEELYVLGTRDEQTQFIQTVREILKLEQPVKIIFSIREEYLGHLFEFEKAVPQLMRRKLRVEPMNLDKVRQVIEGVTRQERTNISIEPGQEQAITEAIFNKIKGTDNTLTIQLPYLQVFLDKLYNETTHDETHQAEAVFTLETITRMGSIGDVLRDFLEDQVKVISRERSKSKPVTVDVIWKILSPFATLEGTKEPMTMEKVEERLPDVNKQLINDVVADLVNGRILRYTDRGVYELVHDTLAKQVAAKRSDEEIALLEVRRLINGQASMKAGASELFTEKQLNFIEPFVSKLTLTTSEKELISKSKNEAAAKKRKLRLTRIILGSVLVAAVMYTGSLAYWALGQKHTAEQQTIKAQSMALSSQAATEFIRNNVTLSFRYAQYAFEKDSSNTDARKVLYDIFFPPAYEPRKLFYKIIDWRGNDAATSKCFLSGDHCYWFLNDSTLKIVSLFNKVQPIIVTNNVMKSWHNHNYSVNVETVGTGKFLKVSTAFGSLFFNVKTGSCVENFEYLSPDNKFLVRIGIDSVGVWKADEERLLMSAAIKDNTGIDKIVFSPDSRFVAFCYNTNLYGQNRKSAVRLFQTDTWKEICSYDNAGDVHVLFSDDSKCIAIRIGVDLPNIFYTATGKRISEGKLGSVFDSTYRIVVHDRYDQIILNKLETEELRIFEFFKRKPVTLSKQKEESRMFHEVIFSPDKRRILTRAAYDDETAGLSTVALPVTLWDAQTGRKIVDVKGEVGIDYYQKSSICMFSPDSKYFLISSVDNHAVLWNAETGDQAAFLDQPDVFFNATFSEDGKHIITSSDNGIVRNWSLDMSIDQTEVHNAMKDVRMFGEKGDVEKIFTVAANPGPYDKKLDSFVKVDLTTGIKTITLPENIFLKVKNNDIEIRSGDGNQILRDMIKGGNVLHRLILSYDNKYLLGIFGVWRSFGGNSKHMDAAYATLWSVADSRKVGEWEIVNGLFSPDSKYLFAKEKAKEEYVIIETHKGLELAHVAVPSYGYSYAFSKDSKMLLCKWDKYVNNVSVGRIEKAWYIDPRSMIRSIDRSVADLPLSEKENSKYGIINKITK